LWTNGISHRRQEIPVLPRSQIIILVVMIMAYKNLFLVLWVVQISQIRMLP